MIISCISCTDYEQKIIVDIKSDSDNYDKLIETINKCDLSRFKYNQYISKEYFPENLVDAINKTVLKDKVRYIVIDKETDCDSLTVEIISGRLHIRYEPCPRPDFPKANIYVEEGLIETWGINNNWMIWKDNDYI